MQLKLLKSNLCDYKNAYSLVKGYITNIGHNVTRVALKSCVPFIKCFIKLDGTTIDHAEDLDMVVPMYNLLEYSSHYSELFWNNIADDNAFKSFK